MSNPKLKYVPMAVAGNPETRHGIILAKNELAKKYDIKTAETIWQAKKKCPELVLVSPNHDKYKKFSVMVNDIYKQYTDLVEPFGIDESWLDVTAGRRLFGDGVTIADTLRERVKKETGLTISVGVSFNKVFAKLGSDLKKPDATTVISFENYRRLIYPLPANTLLYVGKSTSAVLERLNIKTIGELAAADKNILIKHLGKAGEMLYSYANGLDNSPVKSIYEKEDIKSVSKGLTFSENIYGEERIKHEIYLLADDVASRLRRAGMKCTTVQLTVRNPDFRDVSRQMPLEYASNITREIAHSSIYLMEKLYGFSRPVRMITVSAANLINSCDVAQQLSLFDDGTLKKRDKQEKIEDTLDQLKQQFGDNVIKFGYKSDKK